MADYNLGTARGRIKVDYDGTGVAQAKRDATSLDKTNKSLHDGFRTVAVAAGGTGAAIAAGLGFAVFKAVEFEKQISAIGAVSGATRDQLEALRQKALQLGASTVFSASEAAGAMEELAKAGVPLEGILNGAADATVALAAAGAIDLAQAAEIAANAMNAFRLNARDLPRVADLIAGAANASSISVGDFGFSLAQAGAVAKLVGVSFDDLAVAIALMGQNGIKGSDAGTSLKTMLSNLQPVTRKQKDLFRDLGLTLKDGSNAFFDARGNLKSLAEISGLLNSATSGLTAQQKQLTLETIFGSDAIRAAAILTGAGAKGFNEMAAAMGKVTAEDVAAARLDNTAGAIEQFKGSVETAGIQLGTIFLPLLTRAVNTLGSLANKFSGLDPKWQKFIAFGAAAAAAGLLLIAAIAGIGFAVTGAGAAFAAFGGVVLPVLAVVAAVAALVAGLILLARRSEGFRETLRAVVDGLKDAGRRLLTTLQPFFAFVRDELLPLLRDGFREALSRLQPAFAAIADFIRTRVAPAFEKIRAALETAMPTIIAITRVLAQGQVRAWKLLASILGTVIPILLKIAGPIFSALITALAFLIRHLPEFVAATKAMIGALLTVGKVIVAAFVIPLAAVVKAVQVFVGLLRDGIEKALAFWSAIWGFFGPVVKSAFGAVAAVISTVLSILRALFEVFWTFTKAGWEAVSNAVLAVVRPIWSAISTAIAAVVNFLRPLVAAAWEFIRAAVTTATNALLAVVIPAWNLLKSTAATVWGAISGVIVGVWNFIVGVISKAVATIAAVLDGFRAVLGKVKGFFDGLRTAAEGGVGSLLAFVAAIPGKVLAALGNLAGLLFQKGKDIVQGLIDGIASMFGKVTETAKGLVKRVTDFLPGSPAKKGPLSGQGYAKVRGQHLVEDFSLGITDSAILAQRAIAEAIDSLAAVLPRDNGSAVNAAIIGSASGGMPPVSVAVAAPAQPTVNVNTTVHAPQNMNPDEVGEQVARRIVLGVTTKTSTRLPITTTGGRR